MPEIVNLVIGVSVSLGFSCISSLGVNLQANALKQERQENYRTESLLVDESDSELSDSEIDDTMVDQLLPHERTFQQALSIVFSSRPPLVRQEAYNYLWLKSQWTIGFLLYFFSQMFGSVIALSFISPMLLAPLGSIGLVFNIFFSWLLLGTRITRFDWFGTAMIVLGCKTIEDLLELFARPAFIVYFSIQIGLIVLLLFLTQFLTFSLKAISGHLRSRLSSIRSFTARSPENNVQEPESPVRTVFRSSSVSALSSMASLPQEEQRPLITRSNTYPNNLHRDLLHQASTQSLGSNRKAKITSLVGMLYASVGGTTAAQTLLLTKSGVELILSSIFGSSSQFQGIAAFVILLLIIFYFV
ncbi:hypothetical protein EDD86DRAFT_245889 [Gorgonomyces haynaldii]|nr:hypothetical protein EDD86DRAFT_245889 [Gorgonomyces haynaldii]